MRSELFYNPLLLLERVGQWATERSRLRQLHGTVAEKLKTGHIDSLELLKLLHAISPQVIYDVGANVGTWTLLAKSIFPNAEIHAFEPLDSLRREFEQQTSGLTKVIRHPIGLGSRSANMTMHLASFIDASSLLEMTQISKDAFALQAAGKQPVKIESLDEYMVAANLPPPNLIKLDIQGYELEALRGAEKALQDCDAVLSEVSFVELYREQALFHQLVGFLADRGFRAHAFGYATQPGRRLLYTDILFER